MNKLLELQKGSVCLCVCKVERWKEGGKIRKVKLKDTLRFLYLTMLLSLGFRVTCLICDVSFRSSAVSYIEALANFSVYIIAPLKMTTAISAKSIVFGTSVSHK